MEEPDITPGSRRLGWLPPFGNRVQTAIGQFSVRTLVRSRQHRMILAFYLGIGFALTIFLLKAPAEAATRGRGASDPWHEANTPLLAASIVMMALAIVGTRVVFAMPLDLRANWIFRVTGVRGGPKTWRPPALAAAAFRGARLAEHGGHVPAALALAAGRGPPGAAGPDGHHSGRNLPARFPQDSVYLLLPAGKVAESTWFSWARLA